jgi:hypothetical protein
MKKGLLYWIAILMVAIVSVGFLSCGDDDNDNNSNKVDMTYNYVYHHIEGRYVGTFDDLYDQSDIKYSGYVDISKVPNSNGKYNVLGIGGENIAIAGEYWLEEYDPSYDDDGEYGRESAQIRFIDRDFWDENDNSVLYWRLESGFIWLRDMQMNLTFQRFVMGEQQSNEPRWYYRFVGKKDF